MVSISPVLYKDLLEICQASYQELHLPQDCIEILHEDADQQLHFSAPRSGRWSELTRRLQTWPTSLKPKKANAQILERIGRVKSEWEQLPIRLCFESMVRLEADIQHLTGADLNRAVNVDTLLCKAWKTHAHHLASDEEKLITCKGRLASLTILLRDLLQSDERATTELEKLGLYPTAAHKSLCLGELKSRVNALEDRLAAILSSDRCAKQLRGIKLKLDFSDILYKAWTKYLEQHSGLPLFHHSLEPINANGEETLGPCSHYALWQALAGQKKMRSLDLAGLPCDAPAVHRLVAVLEQQEGLKHVRLAQNGFSSTSWPVLAHALSQHKLETCIVEAKGLCLDSDAATALCKLLDKQSKHLTRLDLRGVILPKSCQAQLLDSLSRLRKLKVLDLRDSTIENLDPSLFSHIASVRL